MKLLLVLSCFALLSGTVCSLSLQLKPRFLILGGAAEYDYSDDGEISGIFLNSNESEAGYVAMRKEISEIVMLHAKDFVLSFDMMPVKTGECHEAAFAAVLGGGLHCFAHFGDDCEGASMVFVQNGHDYLGSPGSYIVKEGKIVDYSDTVIVKEKTEVDMYFDHDEPRSYLMHVYVDGEDIFEQKQEKGYDMAFSENDISDRLKIIFGGLTSGCDDQIYKLKKLQLEVPDVMWTQEIIDEIGDYVKVLDEDDTPTFDTGSTDSEVIEENLLATVGDSISEPEWWIAFSAGAMVAAVASLLIVRWSNRATGNQLTEEEAALL